MEKEQIYKHITPLIPIPTSVLPRGRILKSIKCLLFDIYGTLFISDSGDIGNIQISAFTSNKLQNLFRRYGIKESPEVVKNTLLHEIMNTHELLKKRGIDFPEIQIEKIWKTVLSLDNDERIRQFAIEYEMITNRVYPMPNLQEVLYFFSAADLLMGLVSNAQFFTPMLFKWFFKKNILDFGFHRDLLFFSYEIGYAKPSMKLYDLASETLKKRNITPEEVLYIGNDILNDVYPAQKTGFKTALFAGDKRSLHLREDDRRCSNTKPDLIITNLIQLKKYLIIS
ncbi:MAG: HAD family hydrolase [Desulfobacterales bacterium]|nr:HAD family hydrolase [Desulfobacterales bacterium]